jgi:hypothetical protein
MKSPKYIKTLIRNAKIHSNLDVNQAVLKDLLKQIDCTETQKPAASPLNIRRTVMKNRITKLAITAVVIVAVVLGLFEFLGGNNPSGVVWAEVAQKVEASRGVIYRNRATRSGRPADSDYSIVYLSDTKSRHDSYKGEEIIRTTYCDFNAKTVAFIAHDTKKYMQDTMSEETLREQHSAWASPKRWITEFLSRDYRKLGQKTIDGVLCEGLETTDTTFGVATFEVDSMLARVWVSVETGYPVMLEGEVTGGGDEKIHIKGVLDQFQWDVELDPSFLEPNIPPDYVDMRTL